MYYALYPKYDATIYEKHNDRNTGIDEILELFKIAENTDDPEGGYWESTWNSRILLQFDIANLTSLINAGTVSQASKYYLVLKATEATDLPVDYNIHVYPVSQSWVNGNGSYNDYPEITNGVSWLYRNGDFNNTGLKWISGSYVGNTTGSWQASSGGGTWYTGSGFEASQSYDYEDPDLRINVTDIVHKWLSSSIDNNGFMIKRSDADEASTTHLGSIKYFSKDTHTIFQPRLEAVWDDSNLAGTGSFTEVSSTDTPVIYIKNIRPEYKDTEKVRFRISSRNRFPARTYSTSSNYLTSLRLPTSSFYAIKDSYTEMDIIPFDTGSTRVSCDTNGNYFDVNMNSFLPERFYKIVFQVQQEGGAIDNIIDNKFYFKVRR